MIKTRKPKAKNGNATIHDYELQDRTNNKDILEITCPIDGTTYRISMRVAKSRARSYTKGNVKGYFFNYTKAPQVRPVLSLQELAAAMNVSTAHITGCLAAGFLSPIRSGAKPLRFNVDKINSQLRQNGLGEI